MNKLAQTLKILSNSSCFILLFIIIGCNKNIEITKESKTSNSLVQLAKKHFNILLKQDQDKETDPKVENKYTVSRRLNPMSKLNSLILWTEANEYKSGELNYLIIPLKESIKPFKNKSFEFCRKIIFYQTSDQKVHMNILEVLSKKNASLGNELDQLAHIAFENQHFLKAEKIGNINASVLFYNENYIPEKSFSLKNGKWIPARISFRSDLQITL